MKYVVANWKMAPKSRQEAANLFAALSIALRTRPDNVTVVLCPPFPWLALPENVGLEQKRWQAGAQDVFWEERGAHTGEVSIAMLDSLRVTYVIVGHSERRMLGETNDIVAKKLQRVLSFGMHAILCVGERSREGDWHAGFRAQIETALAAVEKNDIGRLLVAYEPIWAIGGSSPDTPDDALSAALFVRKCVRERFGEKQANNLPVLYGGSIEPATVIPFANQEGLNGVLVGHDSLNAADFAAIVEKIAARR